MNGQILNRFASNPVDVSIGRSRFDLSHGCKFTFDVGEIIPFYVNSDILPGDTFEIATSKVVRLQPLVSPIMDNLYLDTYWFFVPHRLVWDHWKEFQGENNDGYWTQTNHYEVPQVKYANGRSANAKTILDYMGIVPGVTLYDGTNYGSISSLPLRAYVKTYNDWFRSEDLLAPIHLYTDDNSRTLPAYNAGSSWSDVQSFAEFGNIPPLRACKYFDMFTSCLPSTQRGPAVKFDLVGLAPVSTGSNHLKYGDDAPIDGMKFAGVNSSSKLAPAVTTNGKSRGLGLSYDQNQTGGPFVGGALRMVTAEQSDLSLSKVVPTNLWADLAGVAQFSINELRQAFAIQRYYEKLARGGARYISMIKSFFGVDSSDARMQRPEYLGGSRLPLNISQVEQTSATETGLTPLGDVAGMSVTGDVHGDFIKSFEEHGTLLGLAVVRYNHSYSQGIAKQWFRKGLFDFYLPVFANLSEQPIYNKQIYANTNYYNEVFGYNEAWCEYRFENNRIAGEFRSSYTTSLDFWHLGDDYNSLPTLTSDWILEDKSPLDRCLAVTSAVSNQLIADFWLDIKAVRAMPAYSIPGLIDHH